MKLSTFIKFNLLFILLPFIVNSQIPDPNLFPFYHGVASGDALSDRVIIWTRVTIDDSVSVNVTWKMATDTLLTQVVQSGAEVADTSTDFTVKVDVVGLLPDMWYYYQFEHQGRKSLVGRTKTLPVDDNQKIRLAIVSCSRYGGNFYNVYKEISQRNDIQAVVHLGDYIYEGSGSVSGRGIQVLPTHEIITLEDYRLRYNTYRLDPDLRRAHQQYPFYNVWDDHETANDSWYGGAEEDNDTTEGPWAVRKANGQKAYFEWLPIRQKSPGSYSIYRSFSIGNLADLIMIDSRLEGRDKQADALDQTAYADTNRTILGTAQMQWLKDELSNSQTKWKIIGNQVMFAPLQLSGFAFSYDQWDGYQADRDRIISHVINNNINNVAVITGDIHTSWANDVPQRGVSYNASTGSGSAFVEFIAPSVSTGAPSSLGGVPDWLIKLTNPHIKYVDLTKNGYIVLDLDTNRAQGDWYHVSTVNDSNFTVSQSTSWYVNNRERFLRQASSPAASVANSAPFAPLTVSNPALSIDSRFFFEVSFKIYPNPVGDWVIINFPAVTGRDFTIQILDVLEKEIANHKNETHIDFSGLPKGMYYLRVTEENTVIGVKRVVKL